MKSGARPALRLDGPRKAGIISRLEVRRWPAPAFLGIVLGGFDMSDRLVKAWLVAGALAGMWREALASDGAIVPWGDNGWGQLDVPGLNGGFVAIAGSHLHFLGVKADGSIVAWGYNQQGQCDVPAPNTDFVAASGGFEFTLGLKADGSILAWGSNSHGQCSVPAPNSDFVAVAGGLFHSLGLKANGSIVAWGRSEAGQLDVPPPNSDFTAIAAGAWHNLGLKADGSVVAWGWNGEGQCNVPPPNTGYVAVAAGYYFSAGLKADGSVVVWGDNSAGQLDVPEPNDEFTSIVAGTYHVVGLKHDGSIVAWGRNDEGQCDVPTSDTGFVAIAAGWENSLGLHRFVPAATVVGAVSRKACDLALNLTGPLTSEPRQGGISELWVLFNVTPATPESSPIVIDERFCSAPGNYGPYTGSAVVNATVTGNELVLAFTPPLENGRTYRLTPGPDVTSVSGQFIEVRGLLGDVTNDGSTDGADRSVVVGYWTGPGFSCSTDLNNDGATNATDRSIVVGAWTGTNNCAP